MIDKNCMYLKYTTCYFDIHCEIISTSKLITISIIPHSYLFNGTVYLKLVTLILKCPQN